MDKHTKPTIQTGLMVGILLTAGLVAVFFLATRAFGTPFAPFDVFDWSAKILPGALISFGIENIVNLISTFRLGETSSAAKTAEHVMAVVGMFITCVIASGVLFAILNRVKVTSRYLPGLILGLVIGAPVMLISRQVNLSASTSPFISSLWIVVAFIGWGVAVNWAYDRLTLLDEKPKNDAVPDGVQQLDRRRFLVTLGGASAVITVVGGGVGLLLGQKEETTQQVALNTPDDEAVKPWSDDNPLPNTNDPVQPAPGTRPELTPLDEHYRIDINTLPPVVNEDDWMLQISGLVENPTNLKLNEIVENYEPRNQFVTLACISNRVGGDLTSTTLWTGVPLKNILSQVKPTANATHLKITSADNFDEYVAIDTVNNDERIMLAYAWDGLPLKTQHGFPLRVYIPNHYGMKQPKWITTIEAVAEWQPGWWVRRGWDKDAIMKTTSVIDTVAVNDIIAGEGDAKFVPLGGIAHAGARGISKVEVQTDDGDWVEAELRQPLSETTWVIWRYNWPFQSGSHTFSVRTYDADGTPQSTVEAPPHPSGASGIDSVRETV